MKALLLIVVSLFFSAVQAQSIVPLYGQLKLSNEETFQKIDTGVSQIHRFSPLDPFFFSDLGNPSTPTKNLCMDATVVDGFRTGFDAWNGYFDKTRANKFWDVKRPYTDILYAQGQNRLLGLQLIHSQNIRKGWNAGIEMNRYGSKGFYLNQNSDISWTRLFQSYHSLDGRHRLLTSLIFDKASHEINGGVTDQADFNQSGILQRSSYPVWLSSTVNYMKQNNLMLEYCYGFNKLGILKDSVSKEYRYQYQLFYTFERSKSAMVDSSLTDDMLLYNNIFKDSLRNFDSTAFINYNQEVHLASTGYRKSSDSTFYRKPITWQAGYGYQYQINYISDFLKGYSMNQFVDARMDYRSEKHMQGYASAKYYWQGFNVGDYIVEIGGSKRVKRFSYGIFGSAQQYSQPLAYQYYKTNHYFWQQDLRQTQVNTLRANFQISGIHPLQVVFKYQQIQNLVYFDQHSRPVQHTETLHHMSLMVKTTYHFKKIYLNENLLLQYNSNLNVTPLPSFATKTDIYFCQKMKKNPLKYQVGISIHYWQKTKAYRWNPSIMQFVIDSLALSGGYPMIDIYASGEIKRFGFFIKLEHALYNLRFLADPWQSNLNFLPASYYASASNPMQPQALRLGFRWRFYD